MGCCLYREPCSPLDICPWGAVYCSGGEEGACGGVERKLSPLAGVYHPVVLLLALLQLVGGPQGRPRLGMLEGGGGSTLLPSGRYTQRVGVL